MDTIKITLIETRLSKNPNTKTTYIVDSKKIETVTEKQHDLTTNDDTCKWFRRLGGSETKQMNYTYLGYVCTKLTSISPDRQTKIIREYEFSKIV
jgi:hypothetical protein